MFIWRYDCSYSDVYLIKISQDLTLKQQLKYNYTKRNSDDRRDEEIECETGLTATFDHLEVLEIDEQI